MASHLIAKSKISLSDLPALRDLPEFRKATPSMMMAAQACSEVLKSVDNIKKEDLAVVLGSNLGELETTLEFLQTFYKTKVARPVLFQNSLHNAILGFLTIHLGIKGPSTTVSLEEKTFLAALLATQLFLQNSPYTLLVATEYGHPRLNSWLQESSMKAWKVVEHADAFLFANDDGLKHSGRTALRSYSDLREAQSLADWLK